MKISGAIIQERNIRKNTDDDFVATYKKKYISVTTNHGHGKPKYDHLRRFDVTVTDLASGMYDVDAIKDCHTIKDAIRYALEGSLLI